MAESKKWKSKFLSSSFPLEYDVAKMMVSKGFHVQADYSYPRTEGGLVKDFSVDVMATAYTPFSDPNKITSALNLLVECKYRDQNTSWVFLPDVNKPDFSDFVLGHTLRIIDNFSFDKITNEKASIEFDSNKNCTYKGIEIKFGENPNVYDSELKHGISQLQYALPKLIADNIEFNIYNYPEENNIFMVCPILVTTAELILIDKSVSVDKVINCDNLSELGKKVPYLILYSDCGSDFEDHCKRICKPLGETDIFDKYEEIEEMCERSNLEISSTQYPSEIASDLLKSSKYILNKYFTQFIICDYDAFPELVDNIKDTAKRLLQSRKSVYLGSV